MEDDLRKAVIAKIEGEAANIVYLWTGVAIFVFMYFMSDCMYTKEVGLILLGYIGAKIK
jgi:hypothetical protein